MAIISLHGDACSTVGQLPEEGTKAPDFVLTNAELTDVSLSEWQGRRKLLNIFPSIDTPVCAKSTKMFSDYAKAHPEVVMLMISADLPFAHKRFCVEQDIDNVVTLSSFRDGEFSKNYGMLIEDGPLAGLLARAVVVIDEDDTVVHAELVKEIADEPNYDLAVRALGSL